MKYFYLTLLLCLTIALPMQANPISREEARQKAEQFLKDKQGQKHLKAVTNQRRLAPRRTANTAPDPYYVFDRGDNEGFVIVSGDDQTISVLGYTDSGSFDYGQMPPAMQEWLDGYASQLARIQAGAPVITDVIPTHPRVEPMMKSKWSQGDPYNRLCPLDNGSRSVTGCVATAFAQLLYYNREKSVTETQADIPAYETWTKKIHVDGIPAGSAIDWDHMVDTYGSATEIQKTAVAQLMLYCGVAVNMDYTNGSSGAQSYEVYNALRNYFGYGSSVKYYSINDITSDVEWDRIVYAEMAAGRPIYISGANSSAGHAFVAHGYDGAMRYYINWGWGGQSDGWYYLTNLTPGDGQGIGGSASGYNGWREIVVGIEPENYQAKAMSFSDATVRNICLSNWDADGNGKLTYGEAAAVTSLGTAFQGQNIKTFNELYYFTGLTAIEDDAFNGCSQLTAIRLPKSLKQVGERAFKDCAKLTQLDFFASMKTIGAEAFSGCKALASIVLPEELPSIGAATFKNCAALTEIELPVCVESLGDEAFSGCSSLTDFTVNTLNPEKIIMGTEVFANTDLSVATLHMKQGMKAYFASADQWKDFGNMTESRERSGGQFADIEAGKTYYLYNIGTGRYLTKGEAWGTQAIVGDTPMRFKLNRNSSMAEDVYYLTSPDTGKSGIYLFRTKTDSSVGNNVPAAFVDGSSLSSDAHWHIKAVKDKTYTIQIPSGYTDYAADKYWGVQTDHTSNCASPTYGVYSDVDYDTHEYNCQWMFAPYDETQATTFDAANVLENLLKLARKRSIKYSGEQAVYDNLNSTLDEIRAAQASLRKKMNLIEFADPLVRTMCVTLYDSNTDGEVGISEAAEISDLGSSFSFTNNTSLKYLDELKYFTSVPDILGTTFSGCTNLETVTLPAGLVHIYYNAFYNCKKLSKINIPGYVTTIGANCFTGCTALREVTVDNPDPACISLGTNIFGNVDLSLCTLRVPFGSKALYEAAPTWKDFGQIVEYRTTVQPKFSPITENKSGYLYNIGTRMMVTIGEAYGTQSVVGIKGRLFQWRRSTTMADNVYYLYDMGNSKHIFRTADDSKIGKGVKACFGDGSLSSKAYWKAISVGDNIYTLQVPEGDSDFTESEYLGIDEHHDSEAASPTYGLYWDIKNAGKDMQWAFITKEDMDTAKTIDQTAAELAQLLDMAKTEGTDVSQEEAVYNNINSTLDNLQDAIASARTKLHFINFADAKAKALCVTNWDANDDGEIHESEVADVADISQAFRKAGNIKTFEELRYFTALTAIPDSAFIDCTGLTTIAIPKNVQAMGKYAFLRCSNLKYVIMENDQQMVPRKDSYVPTTATLFVPADRLADYKDDEDWSTLYHLSVYTGQPVVSAIASREYGRMAATIKPIVDGAPVEGEPVATCDKIKETSAVVGEYPITVSIGTVSTPNAQIKDGVFTVLPAPMTATAKSYTREKGEPNPTFEITFGKFRNRETSAVFIQQPVATCDADENSPAGEYEIRVSGGEAQNYAFTYVSGTLTVTDATGIDKTANSQQPTTNGQYYDLQGRRVHDQLSIINGQLKKGLYIRGNKKVVVR